MASPLADRLSMARHEGFVGRSNERGLFHSALAMSELPFHVMYIYGPGGVGKTSILAEFSYHCAEAETPVVRLDGRNIEPSPESFMGAIRTAMGLSPQDLPLDAIASANEHYVILLDTAEALAPLDAWLFESFIPQLPENVLTVLAGRNPPSASRRSDPGWQSEVRTIALRNLSPTESRVLLAKRGVPTEQHNSILQFTHGHPLALSLVADVFTQRPDTRFQPEAEPDVIRILLEHLVQRVPGPAHRRALEICAVLHTTTEGLLAEMLAIPDAHELFDWLRHLSFIEQGHAGVFPHDMARETLNADLRWRDPDWYAEIHRRARGYYIRRLQNTRGPEQHRVLFDYIFLHRDNPVVKPFFEWQETGNTLAGPLRPSDIPSLLAMVKKHEGEESSRLAEYWLSRMPEGVVVCRDARDEPVGFGAMVSLTLAGPSDTEADPATRAARSYLAQNAPLRPGERATLFRFWMARDTYQAVSSVQSLIFVIAVRHYLSTPGLAFTFFPCADPEFWSEVFAYADLERLSEADFHVGGRRYGVYGHDWRARPPLAWLELLGERETADILEMEEPRTASLPLVVLSQPDFEEAVREALRNFTRADALDSNLLLRSRVVIQRAGSHAKRSQRISALRDLLREAAESLKLVPRERRFYDALYHTYIQPEPTQERASELLDVPFSTFRRHLRAGVTRVVEILWERELGAS